MRACRGEEGGVGLGHSGSRRAVGVGVGRGEGRAARAPGPTPDQAATRERLGRPAHDMAPRPMQLRHGPELQGTCPRVRGQTLTGSRLVARGPESWGGHTRGELWPGGPGQARVSCRRNLAPMGLRAPTLARQWWGAPGTHDHPSPGVPRERLPKDRITPGAGWHGGGPRWPTLTDTPGAGPRPDHRPR